MTEINYLYKIQVFKAYVTAQSDMSFRSVTTY